jgi:hypothetical protein
MIIRGSETVIIKRVLDSNEVDKYNMPITTTTNITIKNCLIAFNATNEEVNISRNPEDAQLTLYMPAKTLIKDGDVFNIRNTDFVKDGMAAEWVSPFPMTTGVVVIVRKRHG